MAPKPKDFSKDIAEYQKRQKRRLFYPLGGSEFPFEGFSQSQGTAKGFEYAPGESDPFMGPGGIGWPKERTPSEIAEQERRAIDLAARGRSVLAVREKQKELEAQGIDKKEAEKMAALEARATFEAATPVSGPETRRSYPKALEEMEYDPSGDAPYSSVAEYWDSEEGFNKLLALDKKRGLAPGTSRKAIAILGPSERGPFRGQGYPEERFAYGGFKDLAQEVSPEDAKPYRFKYPGEGPGKEMGTAGWKGPTAADVLDRTDDLSDLEAIEIKETAAPPPPPGADYSPLSVEISEDIPSTMFRPGEKAPAPTTFGPTGHPSLLGGPTLQHQEDQTIPEIAVTGSYENAMAGKHEKWIDSSNSENMDPEALSAATSFVAFIYDKYGIKMDARRLTSTPEEQLILYPPETHPEFYTNGVASEHTLAALNEAGRNRIFHSDHVRAGAVAIDWEMKRLGELSPEFAMLVKHGNQFGLYFDMIKSEKMGGTDGIEWWHWSYNPELAAKQAEEWANDPATIPGQKWRTQARMGEALPENFGKDEEGKTKTKAALAEAHRNSLEMPLAKRIREIAALEGSSAIPGLGETSRLPVLGATTLTPKPTPSVSGGVKEVTKTTAEGGKETSTEIVTLEGMKDHLGKVLDKANEDGGPAYSRRVLMAEQANLAGKYNHAELSEHAITQEIHARQTLVEEDLEAQKLKLAEAVRKNAEFKKTTGEVLTEFEYKQSQKVIDEVDAEMEQGKQLLDEVAKSSIDPWRMFGFHDDDGEFSVSKTALTIGSITALLGNLFLSTASALKGKGQIPLYIYDMISDSIDRDVGAQIASLRNKRAAVNMKFTAAGQLQDVHKNTMVIAHSLRTQMLKQAQVELDNMQAGIDLERDKEVIRQTVPLLNAEYLKGRKATYKEALQVLSGPRGMQMQGLKDEEVYKGQIRAQWLSIYGFLAKSNKTRGLSKADEDLLNKVRAFRPLLDDYKRIWGRHGDNLNFIAKHLAEHGLGPLTSSTLMTIPRFAKSQALAALQELETIRESNAAIMHAFSGDKGPVAVQEQWFAKGRLPMGHDKVLGNKLIDRMYAFMDLIENRAYLAMPKAHRDALNQVIGSYGNNPTGMSTAMRRFNKDTKDDKRSDLPTLEDRAALAKTESESRLNQPLFKGLMKPPDSAKVTGE